MNYLLVDQQKASPVHIIACNFNAVVKRALSYNYISTFRSAILIPVAISTSGKGNWIWSTLPEARDMEKQVNVMLSQLP